jgi:magnesium-transporting ATPase (P-type)
VLREGKKQEISLEEIVPGDMIILNGRTGLTGETYPVEKQAGVLRAGEFLSVSGPMLFLWAHTW